MQKGGKSFVVIRGFFVCLFPLYIKTICGYLHLYVSALSLNPGCLTGVNYGLDGMCHIATMSF